MILHVSLNTIKFHLKNVYHKLGGVENRWAAVAHWQSLPSGLILPHTVTRQNISPKTKRPSP